MNSKVSQEDSQQSSPEFLTPPESVQDFSKNIVESEPIWLDGYDSEPLLKRLRENCAQTMTPPKIRNAAQWADDKRILPPGSAEAGEWRSSRVPWTTKIHERIADISRVTHRVVAMFGSQMSKTDGICLNIAGHRLDEDPVPVLYVGPTKSNIDNVIEPRVDKMFKSCASLASKLLRGKKSKKLVKQVGGVTFRMAWAGSATEMASQPAAIVIIDEVDRMKEIDGEGDPVTLGEARTATYPDYLIVLDSTPTMGSADTYIHPDTGMEHWKIAHRDDIQSPIWWYWQEGTLEEWAVPCLHCGKYFIPRFKYLVFHAKAGPIEAARDAHLACFHCGGLHSESQKSEMNSRGDFIAPGQWIDEKGVKHGELPPNEISSFWVSGLVSPWVSYGASAAKWLRAVESGETAKIQGVLNTRFGELFKMKGEAPKWESVKNCSVPEPFGIIPSWVQRIYMTVDVQKERMIYNIRGWGVGFQSRLIEKGEIFGSTDKQGPWDELETLLSRDLGQRPLNKVAIDSGYRAGQVYEFCERFPSLCIPTKGQENPRKLFQASDIEVDEQGKKKFLGIKLWLFDSIYFKTWVHDRVNQENHRGARWELPSDIDEDYCRQIVAESRMVMASSRVKFVRTHKENHQLDCEALQIFLATMGDVRHLKTLEETAKQKTMAQRASELNG